jgi:hypothetical protein
MVCILTWIVSTCVLINLAMLVFNTKQILNVIPSVTRIMPTYIGHAVGSVASKQISSKAETRSRLSQTFT